MGGLGILRRRLQEHKNFIEILDDVNCIPKGIYKLSWKDDAFFHFELGDVGIFGVSCNAPIRLFKRKNSLKLTTKDEFVGRYYELMRTQTRTFNVNAPLSYGMLNAKYGLEIN